MKKDLRKTIQVQPDTFIVLKNLQARYKTGYGFKSMDDLIRMVLFIATGRAQVKDIGKIQSCISEADIQTLNPRILVAAVGD